MDDTIDKVQFNPQVEQRRCRVCYGSQLPLISLCQCSGSIAFVHEGCILDWITKKMETSQLVRIPVCQICKSEYSARIKIGNKKVSYQLLFKKIKTMKYIQLVYTAIYLIGAILAVYMLISTTMSIMNYNVINLITLAFYNYAFPIIFIKGSIKHLNKRKKLYQQSIIQIVQVTLLPKLRIK